VTAPGSQGVFRGRGRGFGFLKNGRQAAIVLSWLLLVQLPGQVLRSYSSKVSKSKRFLKKKKEKVTQLPFTFYKKNEDEVFTKKKTSKFDHWKSFGFATKMACRYLRVSND
jgi:hypothetical protein